MRLSTFALVASAMQSAIAFEGHINVTDKVLVESLPGVPEGWTKVGEPDPQQILHLRIALKQPKAHLLEEALYNVSTPGHPDYGNHLSARDVAFMMEPLDDSTDKVMAWLEFSGIPPTLIDKKGDWIDFQATAEEANQMLNTHISTFEQDAKQLHRTLEYYVPRDLQPHIDMVAPLTRFGSPVTMKSHMRRVSTLMQGEDRRLTLHKASYVPPDKLDVKTCNTSMTPECLRALYHVGAYKADNVDGARFGVAGFLEEYARYDMLDVFTDELAPYAAASNFSVVEINGGKNDQDDMTVESSEANLDIQYTLALSFDTPVVYYSTGGRGPLVPDLEYVQTWGSSPDPGNKNMLNADTLHYNSQPDPTRLSNEPYLDFLRYMLSLDDSELPQTLTTSYGENEQSVPPAFSRKVCQMFGQLGARGVSVIFASGDSGPGSSCVANDGTNKTRFIPTFPGACPFVTSVGSTRYVNPERAAGFSSGGFSDVFARPAYQNEAVDKYLSILGDQWDGLYNRNGRGFPDVSAQGKGFHIFDKDRHILIDGTSASAPVFASMIAMLNSARLKAGQRPLGFLNPWLYGDASTAFTDIVHGGSTGCRGKTFRGVKTTGITVPYASWNATEGWDPVTGLGTPLFDRLFEISSPGETLSKITRPN